jgi:two-component system chemotaxis response regulator CheY
MKALVIDSSKSMRSVLRRILSKRGFDVAEAENCARAIDVLREAGTVDLVMIDWTDGTDCLEFVAHLRQEPAHDTTILLLVTAEPGQRKLHGALIAGADDFLMKPFTSLQIDEKLAQAGFTRRL